MNDEMQFQSRSNMNRESVTMTTTALDLVDVLECFERFLRAAGFVFDGVVAIVPETEFTNEE